jgi:hypothetical protein
MTITYEMFKENLAKFTDKGAGGIRAFPTVRLSSEDAEHLSEAYDWCEKNLNGEWIWSNPINTDYCDLFFINANDAIMVKMKFGGQNV